MKPIDFKDQKPRLIIEDYLSGKVKAWGILQNRSGKVIRQFSADLNGKWDGKHLILDETFNWSDVDEYPSFISCDSTSCKSIPNIWRYSN